MLRRLMRSCLLPLLRRGLGGFDFSAPLTRKWSSVGADQGIQHYLVKPFNAETFDDKIQEVLQQPAAAASRRGQ